MGTVTRKRLSVAGYDKLVAHGILPETNRLELIEGRLVEKMTKGEQHSASSEYCWRLVDALLPAGWHVRIEKPARLPRQRSEPEPDVSVARGSVRDYETQHPGPDDVALVVEITRTSAAKDRKLARIYAAAGIPVYWILNVPGRRLEVYANPTNEAYPAPTILREGQSVDLVIAGQVVGQIPVANLLPTRP
jgi:Uma2 family endonuclease